MKQPWYKLDNAGKIFPAIVNPRRSNYFRVAVELKEVINPTLLQTAFEATLSRYPAFKVSIKQGLFWFYLEENHHPILVEPDTNTFGIYRHALQRRTQLLHVLYYEKRIALEIFHSLTDGTGAMEFLKTLTLHYLRLKGYPVQGDGMVLDAFDQPAKGEFGDSFSHYFDGKDRKWVFAKHAYHLNGLPILYGGQHITHIHLSAQEFLTFVKSKNVTITAYLASLLVYYLLQERNKNPFDKRPIIVDIPINLRKIYPSQTLRNFVLFVNVGGDYAPSTSFETILIHVKQQLVDGLNINELTQRINAHVFAEKSLFVRLIPMVIKKWILKGSYELFGERIMSTSISNLGVVQVSPSMTPFIDHFEFVLSSSHQNMLSASVCTFEDHLVLSFSRTLQDPEFIRNIVLHLTHRDGLHPIVSSNEWGDSL